MKQFIDRHSSVITWLGGLGVPVAILISGWAITTSIESSKLDSEYVKMALSILSAQRKDQEGKSVALTRDEVALRQWAIRVLNRQAPEKFSPEEQAALLAVPSPFGELTPGDQISIAVGRALGELLSRSASSPGSSASQANKSKPK